MDIGRAISYVFQDPAWVKKTLIGGLLLLFGWLIIPAFIVAGYALRIIQRVAAGNDVPLPEWDDFGGDLVRGLKAFVAYIVWALPIIVLSGCGAILTSGDDSGAAGAASLGVSCVSFFVSLAIWYFVPLVIGRVALTENIGSAFEFNAIFSEARNYAGPLLITLGMSIVLGFAAYFGLILCVIGVVFTFFLSYTMTAHLYGQLRRVIGGDQGAMVPAGGAPIVPPPSSPPPAPPAGGGPVL